MGPSRAEMSDNWGSDRKFAPTDDRGRGGFGGGFRDRDREGGFRDRSRWRGRGGVWQGGSASWAGACVSVFCWAGQEQSRSSKSSRNTLPGP